MNAPCIPMGFRWKKEEKRGEPVQRSESPFLHYIKYRLVWSRNEGGDLEFWWYIHGCFFEQTNNNGDSNANPDLRRTRLTGRGCTGSRRQSARHCKIDQNSGSTGRNHASTNKKNDSYSYVVYRYCSTLSLALCDRWM